LQEILDMSHALYYPTIEFQDEDVIKRSLLVWDGVFRIVPEGYAPSDSEEIREAEASGALHRIQISQREKADAADGFLTMYEEWRSPNNVRSWPAGLDSSTFTRLNFEKIDAKLQPLFEQLATAVDADGFYQIPEELAGGYMFFLANAIARTRNLELLTDSADQWVVGTYFHQDGDIPDNLYDEEAARQLCSLTVADLLPDSLQDVPFEKVLRYVEQHHGERTELRKALAGLQQQLVQCNSREHWEFLRTEFVKDMERAMRDYRKSMAFFGKRSLTAVLCAGVPATLGAAAIPGADLFSPMTISASLGIGALAALASRAPLSPKAALGSYLIEAPTSHVSHDRLHRKFKEFIDD